SCPPRQPLPSFPTRRSSDLARGDPGSFRRFGLAGAPLRSASVLADASSRERGRAAGLGRVRRPLAQAAWRAGGNGSLLRLPPSRSEEHTSELQSRFDLVCRL